MFDLKARAILVGVCLAPMLQSQVAKPKLVGAVSWGFLTPYSSAVAKDSALRLARGALFDGLSGESPLSDSTKPRPLSYPPFLELLELIPVASADVAAVGTVKGGQSYISGDGTTIYSEIQFQVSQVLYSSRAALVTPGATIAALRAGGIVRMPSGSTLIRGCPQSSLPWLHRQYLLLMRYSQSAEAFPIIAGYELSGDQVYLLDNVVKQSGIFSLGQYGKSAAAFLADVAAQLSAAGK
jgi:hypothetical protein